MVPLESLVEKISKEGGLGKEAVEKLIEEKLDELSGLVSKEGAAYIVGRELGVNLIKEGRQEFKIKNIVPNLTSIDLVAKVLRISDIRSFEKKSSRTRSADSPSAEKGFVQNIQIGDETGKIMMVLWGEDTQKFSEVAEGDTVKILQATSKKSINGNIELGLGRRGSVEKSDKKIEVSQDSGSYQEPRPNRQKISDLKENMWGEVMGCFVQVFKRNPFYVACSSCGSAIDKAGACKTHGSESDPQKVAVFSGTLDDGTGTLKVIVFRELAEKVYGLKAVDMDGTDIEKFYSNLDFLGKDFVVGGKIKKNAFSGELELVANKLEEIDAKKECEALMKEIEK